MLYPIVFFLVSIICGISCFVFALRIRLLQEPSEVATDTAPTPVDLVSEHRERRIKESTIPSPIRPFGVAFLYGLPGIVAVGIVIRLLASLNWSLLQMPIWLTSLFIRLAPLCETGAVVVLLFQAAWAIGVIIDRFIAYSAARTQSQAFAPAVAGALREGKILEAIKICNRFNKSHLAKVVLAGLQELRVHQNMNYSSDDIQAIQRALERAEAIVHAELSRGLSSLGAIRSTAPLVGLFGLLMGSAKVLQENGINGLARPGFAEALIPMALSLLVGIPAAWMFVYFTNRVKAFDVEMDNSSSELIDYLLKNIERIRHR